MKYLERICMVVFVGFFILLSQKIHWSDSELWAIGLSNQRFFGSNASTDYKLLFNLLLHSVYSFSSSNLQVVSWARLIFAGCGLTILFLVYWAAGAVTHAKGARIWGFILLGTCTLFLSQGFKVRSDILAGAAQFLGVGYFLLLVRNKNSATAGLGKIEISIGILLNCLVLLATPKGVYNLAVNFSFIAAYYFQTRDNWVQRYIKYVFLVPCAGFVALLLLKISEFKTALDFFISSYSESPQHPAFWQARSFVFFFDALLRNLPLLLIAILGYFQFRKKSQNVFLTPLAVASLASLSVILIHNDRLPFFLLAHFVFPALLAAVIINEISNIKWRKLILVVCVLNAGVFVYLMLQNASNDLQVQTQTQIHEYLQTHQNPLYYDATAALPLDNQISLFPAPQHVGNKEEVLGVLKRPDLELVFMGNRLYYYFEDFYLELEENYFISIGPGVFAKSYVIRNTHEVSAQEWLRICNLVRPVRQIYVYHGQSFLNMKLMNPTPVLCSESLKKIETEQPFIAFSPFEPLEFKADQSFSSIFDHKPFY